MGALYLPRQLRADYVGLLVLFLPDGYAMLMKPNKAETAVHSGHFPDDMAVRMRKVLAGPWVWCSSVSLAFNGFLPENNRLISIY